MKPLIIGTRIALLAGFLAFSARAFPPAPDTVIYGIVKDQYGTPLMNQADEVILQAPSGTQVAVTIQPNLAVGVNYALHVHMDAGTFGAAYSSNALLTATPYLLYVVVGGVTNLPMALFFQDIGTNVTNINPNADYAHDGRTLMQEYLLGNYPYNPTDHFSVKMVSQNAGSAVLAFTTMTGRTYTAYGSADLQNWTPLSFNVPSAGTVASASYFAQNIQAIQIQTVQPAGAPQFQFFRVQLQ
jgi:hypothetical protein